MLDVARVEAARPVWSARPHDDRFDCHVQLRAHGMTSPATVTIDGGAVVAELATPQRGVAAGQALVMYDGDVVLGSATITSAA
jgi:tRNA-specific 2-thiouridylase